MSVNISKIRREKLLSNISKISKKLLELSDGNELIGYLSELELVLKKQKYGLIFEEHKESIDEIMDSSIPVLTEDATLSLNKDGVLNYLIEGDNFPALKILEKTHKNKIDLIYIDPPYNRGENDFIYDDKFVDKEDSYRHSKWLSFMKKRLELSKKLLSKDGVIIIHIDENEVFNLVPLMNDLFGEQNDLGMVIWNKMNPKGDSKGISAMHEYVLCYAKNKEAFAQNVNTCVRHKPNAEKMIRKAKQLFKRIGKKGIPLEIKEVVKPYNYPKDKLKEFEVEFTLELINKEFQNWLKNQDFSSGEKAYKYIDENGEVYRGVSMAWPNKKKAPDDYFIPLIHPVTGKPCPVPHRGWRNPPQTMERLSKSGRLLFGKDENKQPERKYFLKENMLENTPSIYESAASDDKFFIANDLTFEYAKPVDVLKYFITSIRPDNSVVLDFFAGSGSTAHAVMDLNKENETDIKFILVTDNQNNICREVTYERIKRVIEQNAYKASLKYFKVDFIPVKERMYYEYADSLLLHVKELVQLENGIDFSKDKKVEIILTEEDLNAFIENIENYSNCKKIYLGHDLLLTLDQETRLRESNVEVAIIPDYYYGELKR